ncbi:MAG: hypothetical protein ABI467_18225 [Kofleriaceae bacterium]
MKSLLIGIVFAAACAGSQPHYTNVASVRQDIKASIARDNAHAREIISMGHTTDDSAVVFTQAAKDAPRVEETWVRDSAGWKMKSGTDQAAHM